MKNTLSRIEKAFDKKFYYVPKNDKEATYCSAFSRNAVTKFYRHQILALLEEVERKLPKKQKIEEVHKFYHRKDGILEPTNNGAYDYSGGLVNGYNTALREVKTILDNYKKEIQK